jgi:cell division cycle 20-like protein 1 (cofactor of APC complex)
MDAQWLDKLPNKPKSPIKRQQRLNRMVHTPKHKVKRCLFENIQEKETINSSSTASTGSLEYRPQKVTRKNSPECRYIPNRNNSDLEHGLHSPSPTRNRVKSNLNMYSQYSGASPKNRNSRQRTLTHFDDDDMHDDTSDTNTIDDDQVEQDSLDDDKTNSSPIGGSSYENLLRDQLLTNQSPHGAMLRYQVRAPQNTNIPSTIIHSPLPLSSSNHHPGLLPSSSPLRSQIFSPSRTNTSSTRRKIPTSPLKVLDAPNLQDDFYLNLVDWGASNILAVGLGESVYLWNASSGQVAKLCSLNGSDEENMVTSVCWMGTGSHVAVGSNDGVVQLWDVTRAKCLREFTGHTSRVGCLSWNGNCLSSGSRDRTILHRDTRMNQILTRLMGHKQEVCGLKWSNDGKELASGGNDNNLFVWRLTQQHETRPFLHFDQHVAAVKAIAWSPHQHGLLASGGGTADRCIRFWNTLSGKPLNYVDTGSQVCNIAWSENTNELVSTHGYSQNQINIWRYPSMNISATLTGHSYRVLFLSVSPDGQNIVTGAGDESLRLWNVFPPAKTKGTSHTNHISYDIR